MTRKKMNAKGMIDVGLKKSTSRMARAFCTVQFSDPGFQRFLSGQSPKGPVLECAKIAGILAAKATPQMIPMCHPLLLDKVAVDFAVDQKKRSIQIFSEVRCQGRTGVEMEALLAVTVAGLTIYDMMKWADRSIVISDIKLVHKSGGKSGEFRA